MSRPVSVPGNTRILLIFVDGVGLAPPGANNPLSNAPMPNLRCLLGGPLVLNGNLPRMAKDLYCGALDACLGVPGLPQSATGQTALFTGVNAPAVVGDHVTAFPTAALRSIISQHSMLKQAADRGARVLFANAHSERFWETVDSGKRRLAASTLTALAAGARIPTLDDLRAGRAVLWDITHEIAVQHAGYDLPRIAPQEAGRRLARLLDDYDLVLYETFLTDLAGHRRLDPEWVLARIDGFLSGVLDHRRPDVTVLLCSDHGNLEDSTTKSHTTNPVPLLVVGPAAAQFQHARAITDVTPLVVDLVCQNYGS